MKKIAALLVALMLMMTALPAMAEFSAADLYQRCVAFAEEAGFSYDGDDERYYMGIGFAEDYAFSPDGCKLWLFAYEDGISIDVDFEARVPAERYNEMLILLGLINATSSEGNLYAHPESYRIGATEYVYAMDRLPSVEVLNRVVITLYNKLGYYDAMINEVAGGASAWDVYNAYMAEE